ncbi:MAG: hypothetical protein COV07_00500 [Candidatus Vogelbacteria bacterium CG10_big_fil_rev_8_21_14_0_10_45_14]|uniref:Uncharacterized protein n=1 Tax=Candidatus Vogelbacteria bacterium CG10_big_fil_rev_8_21_14_0_10_45_14 TaxID=1975042 RepID=A0A2H0RKT1_9BACT|nr:MAG: hypothetical protein COV07_00500 [Candidatus Vogelbacteria bacterium CG10_big_fil_rev_8_21_14_0_10_45_14]
MNNAEQKLNEFVDKMIEDKGITGLEPDIHIEVRKDLLRRLKDILDATIVHHMPEEHIPEFRALLDRDASEGEMRDFCEKHIADFDQVLASAMVNFRNKYLEGTI